VPRLVIAADPRGRGGDVVCRQGHILKSRQDFMTDHYVLVLLTSGSGSYIDREGKQWPIDNGDLFQRFPGLSHGQEFRGKVHEQLFIRVPTKLFELMNDADELKESPVLKGDTQAFKKQFDYFVNDCRKLQSYADHLWRARQLISSLHQLSQGEVMKETIEQACDMMMRSSHQRPDLNRLAEELNMSYIDFRRKFKQRIGMPPGAWLIQQRIQRAVDLMKSSELTLSDIAHHLSYPDIYSFSKQFKKIIGMSPRKYLNSFENL